MTETKRDLIVLKSSLAGLDQIWSDFFGTFLNCGFMTETELSDVMTKHQKLFEQKLDSDPDLRSELKIEFAKLAIKNNSKLLY